MSPQTRGERVSEAVRVVIVDDVPEIAESLAAALTLNGYEVRVACDGPQALRVIDTFEPHCVLLDIQMPGMDGRELARELRQRYGDDIVLVAVTGYGDENIGVSADFARIDHSLRKPIDLTLLEQILPPQHPS